MQARVWKWYDTTQNTSIVFPVVWEIELRSKSEQLVMIVLLVDMLTKME